MKSEQSGKKKEASMNTEVVGDKQPLAAAALQPDQHVWLSTESMSSICQREGKLKAQAS